MDYYYYFIIILFLNPQRAFRSDGGIVNFTTSRLYYNYKNLSHKLNEIQTQTKKISIHKLKKQKDTNCYN